MPEVAIIGLGQTAVGEHWESSLRTLAAEAVQSALEDAGLDHTLDRNTTALYVGNAYGGPISSQSHLGALVADHVGLSGVEAYALEAAEASGAAALRAGYMAVASGLIDTAIVVGVEKSSDTIGTANTLARTVSLDSDFEAMQGATLTALAALMMRRYLYEHGVELSAFEGFSINAHTNGKSNSNAMFRNTLKPGAFARAPMVADPVSLFDGAPDGDGAATVILTTAERAADLVPQPVRITGSAAATDTLALHDRTDLLFLNAAQLSAQKALAQAGISRDEIDLFELHDAYTILSALTLEAVGFAERGQGWKLAQEGAVMLGGRLPISTFGGLKSRGNPVGATGIYQAVEACLQLRGSAGANQVADAKIALIQNLGGLATTAITHVLQG
ncbi:MAG: thiolase domain-containing protein [Burkholderiales bacterium]|nr:thiolase domain-containing protein [Anaerolineae bacterium]